MPHPATSGDQVYGIVIVEQRKFTESALFSGSYRSDEWNMLSEQERKKLLLTFEDDGEFW